jgi:tRNA-dihydrouridine synthase
MENFRYTPTEHPLIAQIWGKNPDHMYRTAVELSQMGFVGIDINMGCPDRTVMKNECGAAMIETPDVAKAVIAAVKRGAGSLPVSVKTRIGVKKIITEEWASFILDQGIDAFTIHGRTAAEMSKVPAHWDQIQKVVEVRDRMKLNTKIIGNGDVVDAKDALVKARKFGVDGVMIGRGVFNNLWCFDRADSPHVGTTSELFSIMEKHITMFDAEWGERKSYALLKKFFKIYISGFSGASEVRMRFMETKDTKEALALLKELSIVHP